MSADLFGNLPEHDAGSKLVIRLPPGVIGDAEFYGPNDCYRVRLRRWLGDIFPARYINFIAMNPSNAIATANDRTIAREWSFTTTFGFEGMSKTNIADYRQSYPDELLKVGEAVCSDRNIATILYEAAGAQMVVVGFGGLNKVLMPHGRRAVRALMDDKVKMMCFGENADGSPKHPLYIKGNCPLREWDPQKFMEMT